MKPKLKTVADRPSWVVRSDQVQLAVTQTGGHMAPVTFYRDSARPVQPYYISPWHGEKLDIPAPVLRPLRGDFFCMPFGKDGTLRGRRYEYHGETATGKWAPVGLQRDGARTTLTLTMKTPILGGTVTKELSLVDGQNVVYCRHTVRGGRGAVPAGHHATLAMPQRPQSVHLAISPIRFGVTNPVPTGDPATGEYFRVRTNRRFASLSRVPLDRRDEPTADYTAYPTGGGFVDLVAVANRRTPLPAWTAATFEDEGFVWFSLKDPAVLPLTMIWTENHGRHFIPWNGRNSCLGLEDICSYFALGLEASARPNPLSRAGVPTCVRLSPSRPTVVNYIQGVVKVPRGFGKVKTLRFAPGEVRFVSTTGRTVAAPVDHEFLCGCDCC